MMNAESRGESSGVDEDLRIAARVHRIVAERATIEQAKGILMFVCGIDADAAFDVLRTQSLHHNVQLTYLAEQVIADLVDLSRSKAALDRPHSRLLLMTAYQRVAEIAVRQAAKQPPVGLG